MNIKKLFAKSLIVVICAATISTFFQTKQTLAANYTLEDAQNALKAALRIIEENSAYDFNHDGSVTLEDARLCLTYALGIDAPPEELVPSASPIASDAPASELPDNSPLPQKTSLPQPSENALPSNAPTPSQKPVVTTFPQRTDAPLATEPSATKAPDNTENTPVPVPTDISKPYLSTNKLEYKLNVDKNGIINNETAGSITFYYPNSLNDFEIIISGEYYYYNTAKSFNTDDRPDLSPLLFEYEWPHPEHSVTIPLSFTSALYGAKGTITVNYSTYDSRQTTPSGYYEYEGYEEGTLKCDFVIDVNYAYEYEAHQDRTIKGAEYILYDIDEKATSVDIDRSVGYVSGSSLVLENEGTFVFHYDYPEFHNCEKETWLNAKGAYDEQLSEQLRSLIKEEMHVHRNLYEEWPYGDITSGITSEKQLAAIEQRMQHWYEGKLSYRSLIKAFHTKYDDAITGETSFNNRVEYYSYSDWIGTRMGQAAWIYRIKGKHSAEGLWEEMKKEDAGNIYTTLAFTKVHYDQTENMTYVYYIP